ncbi:M56 family metallopeptidase [Mucilaginibacter sp.]|uniref:M56 family metallopeptidase n=1 Tax=Mucilaginibacter sp. TaxID=1882438 RepID=UPI0032652A1D
MKAITYLLQVSACTGIFYAFYFLFLRRLTFFTLNRWYLLITLLLSFIIPALTFTVDTVAPSPMMEPVMYVQNIQTIPQPQQIVNVTNSAPPFDWMSTLQIFYITIAVISVAHLLFTLAAFFLRMGNKKLMQIGHVKVLKGTKKQGNSSFLNVIFINDEELQPEEIKQIITHEMLHVKLMHSADRIIARIVQIVIWFNPFAYLYIRSIEENHEFEVDRIAAGEDEKGMYAQLLFKLAVSGQSYLFHSFSKVPLKKRIAMLFNKPTSNMKKIIYVLFLPVVLISCLAFANLRSDEKLSVVDDLSSLGKHPLVIIDGKEYSDDMLYKIGAKCVLSISTVNPPVVKREFEKYGEKIKDGLVIISTKNHEITYQTAIERENLARKATVPNNQFYARLRLKKEDGSGFDKCMVRLPSGGWVTTDLKTDEPIVFIADGKVFTEQEISKVEDYVKTHKIYTWTAGETKGYSRKTDRDISAYAKYFGFLNRTGDTTIGLNKYRQKVWRNGKRLLPEANNRKAFEDYRNSDKGKQDRAASKKVSDKALIFKVTGTVDTTYHNMFAGELRGFKVTQGNDEYVLQTGGKYHAIEGLVKPGDEIQIKVNMCLYGNDSPLIISPETVTKDGKVIYQAEKEKAADYAFLYEANRVRFTDGKVTGVQKYPNGNWKSAVVEVANGYKIKFNLKPSAPAIKSIAAGDHVWLRFVHEVKTGAKEYTVNDWVALSSNMKDYGIKNPDYFYKYYEKI